MLQKVETRWVNEPELSRNKTHDCDGKLLLPVVVKKLKVVILPVRVVQY